MYCDIPKVWDVPCLACLALKWDKHMHIGLYFCIWASCDRIPTEKPVLLAKSRATYIPIFVPVNNIDVADI